MAISNITKTGGTTTAPIFSAVIDTISFTNIPLGSKGTKGVAFWNHSSNVDVWKDNGDGTKWSPAVNAVDIAWNGATLGSSTINTTGELLSWIKTSLSGKQASLGSAVGTATNPVYWDGSKFVKTTYTLSKSVPSTAVFTDTVKTLPELVGTTAIGNATKPIYWNGSSFVAANNYPSGVSALKLEATNANTLTGTGMILSASTYYTLTVGDKSLIFKTPTDNTGSAADGNTTYKIKLNGSFVGTGSTDLLNGSQIYAPTSLGSANQVLKVNSAGTGLTWAADNTGSSTTVNAATLKSLLVAGPNIAIKAWSDLTDEEKTIYGDSSVGMTDGKLIIINTYQPIDMYYKIQFNKNGGTGTLPSNMGPYASGTMVQIPSVSLTRSGHTLSGWNTKTDGSGTSYEFNSTYVVPSNTGTLTLYAKWIANKTNPTLTINNPASTTIADGATTTITVTSSVAGKLTLTTSSGTGWSATSSSDSTAATSHTITVSNLTSTTASGSIAVGGIIATFTPTDTTNYNTLTNQSVLKQAITLSAAVITNTYYLGTLTEAQLTNQTTVNNLAYNKSGNKPSTITVPSGYPTQSGNYLVFIYPSSWGTPTIKSVNGFGTGDANASDAGISNPSGKSLKWWMGNGLTSNTVFNITWS